MNHLAWNDLMNHPLLLMKEDDYSSVFERKEDRKLSSDMKNNKKIQKSQ